MNKRKMSFYGVEIAFDINGYWFGNHITDGDYNLELKHDEITVPNVDIGEWSASRWMPGPIHQLNPAAK